MYFILVASQPVHNFSLPADINYNHHAILVAESKRFKLMKRSLDACGIISEVIYKLFPGSLSPYYRETILDCYTVTDFFAFAGLPNLDVISNSFYSKSKRTTTKAS